MIICPAQPFDIFQIMNIERQSFIPKIQEKKRIFEKRLKIFPEGFLLLADCSDDVILKNKTALICGYLCAEKWDTLPDFANLDEKSEKLLKKRFSLSHNPALTHKTNGSILYVSSFALLKEYRGKGLGQKFFLNSLAALCASHSEIKKVVLLVNEDWKNARKIYEKIGFRESYTLKDFFPTIQRKEYSDGTIMEAAAEIFKAIDFSKNENAIEI